jgi:hypothetical protein
VKCNKPFFINPVQIHSYKVANNQANKNRFRKHCDKSFVYIDETTGWLWRLCCFHITGTAFLRLLKEQQKFVWF